ADGSQSNFRGIPAQRSPYRAKNPLMGPRQRRPLPSSSRRRRPAPAETTGAAMGAMLIEHGHDLRVLEALVGSRTSNRAPQPAIPNAPSTSAAAACDLAQQDLREAADLPDPTEC